MRGKPTNTMLYGFFYSCPDSRFGYWTSPILVRIDPALDGIFTLSDSFLIRFAMCHTSREFRDSHHVDEIFWVPLDEHGVMIILFTNLRAIQHESSRNLKGRAGKT